VAAITQFLGGLASKVADRLQKKPDSPQDGNANVDGSQLTENQKKYGPNYEDLKKKNPRVVSAIEKLVMEYRLEALYAQRAKIRRIRYARLFWQEIQYAYWNEGRGDFDYSGQNGALSGIGLNPQEEPTGPRYEFVTNFYQGYGLSFCALVSQDIPSLSIFPKSREVQEDITAAKAAHDVAEVIQDNNSPHESLETIGRFFWTDGVCFQYWRYVVDGERFGYKTMPNIGTRNVGGMTLPEDQGQEKIPLGQEVVDYLGGLEVAVPLFADKFHDFGWLQWSTEPDIAQLKEAYPHAADGIQADSGMSAEQVFERLARLGIRQNIPFAIPGDSLANLPTFQRTWLRKWAFNRIDDKKLVQELKDLFPDGAYVAFAGFEYCESRSESMSDHWRVRHALPGDGQARPAVGQALISPQERYNVLSNLYQETMEYGIPPIYADPQVVDFDALASQSAEPAVHYPARARAGTALADSFFQPDPAKLDASIPAMMQSLMGEVAQFLCGMFPAIFGGEMTDVKTASGYQMARDQAMGRLGLVWRGIKDFYAQGIGLGIEIFKKNRPEDVEVSFAGENDEEKARWIRLADLKGNLMVRSEPDEGLPVQNSQQRGVLERLLSMGAEMPPELAKALALPGNIAWIKTVFGLDDLEIAGEDASMIAVRLIQRLLATGPMEFPPQPTPQTNPQTGQTVLMMVAAPPEPTLPVDPILVLDPSFVGDMLAKFIQWAGSDAGRGEAESNPKGYQNVYLYAKQLAGIVQQAQQASQPKIPPKPPSMSVQIDKLPPGPMSQALAMDGIQADPMELQANKDQQRQDKAQELQARLNAKPAAPAQGA
jgi:hypothetical protein